MYYTVQLIQQTFYKNLTGRGHEKSRISAASEAFNAWLYSVTTVENPADMIVEDSLSGSSVKPEFTGDNMRARERLKSYLNYIGEKK